MQARRSLRFFPVQLFAIIMGISGLTIVYAKAYHILGVPYFIYEMLLFVDTILFLTIFTTYMYKLSVYPDAVKKEFLHPIKSSFMATISISFLLLSIAFYDYNPVLSIMLWYIGTPLQLYFTVNILSFWINNEFKEVHSNPAWFIPIVGNVLVPVIGVDAAPTYVSLFFFSIGLFFWVVLFTMVMYRIVFHHPMAKKLIPTLFIFMAPPAVAFISYFRLTFGSIDTLSIFLYSVALVTLFLILFMVKKYDTKQFFISWWAYTFPLTAMTIATMLLNMAFDNFFIYYGSFALMALSTVVIGFVTYRTLVAISQEHICIEEKE